MEKDVIDQYLHDISEQHDPSQVEDMIFMEKLDGIYQTRLDKIYIDFSQKGRLQTVMIFEVLADEHEEKFVGTEIRKYYGMESDVSLDFLVRDLRKMGIFLNSWKDYKDCFPKLLDKCVELKLVTKKGMQNVYINKEIKKEINKVSNTNKKSIFLNTNEDDDVPF